ncbi:hypothetical protein NDU88_007506 [Pleurodeles waltl]|uniref:Uncharacterized protein n=1 Tax=Pleurodeles waltl TaxID=8319 RepID=A0AAV7PM46_PLEWA|nr:hypothetical protein NDU88_007506 [Pleurodeles waltl]
MEQGARIGGAGGCVALGFAGSGAYLYLGFLCCIDFGYNAQGITRPLIWPNDGILQNSALVRKLRSCAPGISDHFDDLEGRSF